MTNRIPRRTFLASSAAGALCLSGMSPRFRKKEEQLRLACIGLGKRGDTNVSIILGENMVALCDVDEANLLPVVDRYPGSKAYVDYRELIEKETLDGIIISTPDHTHAPIALAAMNKGIHVYIEKPLSHNFQETRLIEKKAKETGLVAFMGNQHHATAGYRRAIELLEAKTIGQVKEVHAWTYRPSWQQGVKRPAEGALVPTTLKWDLWLGPAPSRPYHPVYHPVGWRGWWDFGGGALADMGPHLLDPVIWGLKLTSPTTVECKRSDDVSSDVAPSWSMVRFAFPARGDLGAMNIIWYDGGKQPSEEVLGTKQPPANGVMVIGETGKIFIPDLGRNPRVIPNTRGEQLPEPEVKVSLVRGHHQEWLEACRAKKPDPENFAIACRLTELCQLGNIAVRMGKKLKWNAENNQFENEPDANRLLARSYRKGWELPK